MRVKRSDEHHSRHRLDTDLLDHAKPIELGHLDVEEYDVGPVLPDAFDCLVSVHTLRYDPHALVLGERYPERVARELLVIDDDCGELFGAVSAIHHQCFRCSSRDMEARSDRQPHLPAH